MRLAISSWIRQSIVSHICAGENGCLDKSDVVARPSLTLVDFQTVCAVLEDFEDFAVLSDVLDVVVSEATERDLLDGAAEKINTHFDIVYAIGALPELFCRLISRLGDFRTRSPSYRSLLLSLIDLGQRLPNEGRKVRTLHKELVLCEPKSAIAACSPVSDYMAESLQAADSSFAEEMGHLLNSGTSMDRQIMLKVFMAITLKLRQGWNNADVSTPSCFDFLAQLRAFDNVEFDKLLMDWLPEILLWPKPSKLASVLLPLICSGTLSLKSILDRYVMFLREPSASKSKARLSVDVLDFLVAMDFKDQAPALDANPLPQRMYRYFVERACLFRESPSSFVFLIESVFRASACGNPDVESSAQSLTSSPGFQNLIHDLFIHNPSILHELEGFFASGNAQTTILSVIARILGLSTDSAGNKLEQSQADKPSEEAFGSRELHYFLHTANDFNIDICLLKLRLSFAISSAKTADTGPELDSAAAVLIRETNSSSESFSQIWPRRISSLPKNLAIKV
jgi:mediator of RNA polymerase II transcription subunit 12